MPSRTHVWLDDLGYGVRGWLRRYDGALIPHVELEGNPRDLLTYGEYQPDADTTGVPPWVTLQDLNLPAVQTLTLANGQQEYGKTIFGNLRAPNGQPTDIVLEACSLRGGMAAPTAHDGVMNAMMNNRTGGGKIILIDCDIEPQFLADRLDGLRGWRMEVYRCNIRGGVDGLAAFTTTAQANGMQFKMMGCWLHGLTYLFPGFGQDDGTHNDLIQFQGGNDAHIKGNYFEVTVDNVIGTPPPAAEARLAAGHAHNGILVQNNISGKTIDSTVIIEDNWFSHGIQQLNLQEGSPIVRNNHFSGANKWSSHVIRTYGTYAGTGNLGTFYDGPLVGQTPTVGNGGILHTP